jgi:hypothetical protein
MKQSERFWDYACKITDSEDLTATELMIREDWKIYFYGSGKRAFRPCLTNEEYDEVTPMLLMFISYMLEDEGL